MDRKGFAPLIVVGIIAVLVVIGAVGYFAWKQSATSQPPAQSQNSTTSIAIATTSDTTPAGNNSSSQIVVINDQYSLFTASEDLIQYGYGQGIQYTDGGIIATGTYAGYHRLIAGIPPGAPGGGDSIYVFATKDYKTYIVNDTAANYDSPNSGYNNAKVVGFGDIPLDTPPSVISLGNFALIQDQTQNTIYFGPTPSSTDLLASSIPGLTFYADPGQSYSSYSPDPAYLGNDDDVLVKTSSGPLFSYFLVSQEELQNASQVFYEQGQISSSATLYKTYGQIAPGGCGGLATTYVLKNISQNDLVQIGTTSRGTILYTLKDSDHSLNHDEYNSKVDEYTDASGTLHVDSTPGSYSDYVAKNPVLIFQDPWGRWIGLGEFDNPTPGGCGKPVIYLYPPKPTEVNVRFSTPMRLTTDIPTYIPDGWNVLAQPDGELTDLQPQFTDCAAIDSTMPGSEYAQSACDHNDYPYLYWEGQAANSYPIPTGGWVVPQNQISDFLNRKLTEIGLTDKEKNDMMSYWVPQLIQKNTPYYRISFFQTDQMDQFIPMQVFPKPDTVIRVFLDWSALAAIPAVQPQPEVLQHIDRKGFTLVEWGGLKQ
jgi:hypothetical protein